MQKKIDIAKVIGDGRSSYKSECLTSNAVLLSAKSIIIGMIFELNKKTKID